MVIHEYMTDANDCEKIFELLPIILGISTLKDGRYVKVNKQFLDSLNYTENEVIGKTSGELNIFVDTDARKELVNLLKNSGSITDLEFQIRKKSGEIITVLFSAEILNNNFLLASAKDITQLKEVQKNLHESEEQFRQLFESTRDCIAIYEVKDDGNDFIFKSLNPAAEKMEQIKKAEIIGKSVIEIFPGIAKLGLLEIFSCVWKTGKSEVYPVALYEDDKISSWRENYVYKLPNGNIVAIYNDATERITNDEIIKSKVDELERFNKFAIDRELKMIELKREIQELQNKLKNLSEDNND